MTGSSLGSGSLTFPVDFINYRTTGGASDAAKSSYVLTAETMVHPDDPSLILIRNHGETTWTPLSAPSAIAAHARELADKDRRIQELLESNNAYLERARRAERQADIYRNKALDDVVIVAGTRFTCESGHEQAIAAKDFHRLEVVTPEHFEDAPFKSGERAPPCALCGKDWAKSNGYRGFLHTEFGWR